MSTPLTFAVLPCDSPDPDAVAESIDYVEDVGQTCIQLGGSVLIVSGRAVVRLTGAGIPFALLHNARVEPPGAKYPAGQWLWDAHPINHYLVNQDIPEVRLRYTPRTLGDGARGRCTVEVPDVPVN
jgi:hypothetical protein